jgi:hypothetical protein
MRGCVYCPPSKPEVAVYSVTGSPAAFGRRVTRHVCVKCLPGCVNTLRPRTPACGRLSVRLLPGKLLVEPTPPQGAQ